ncbi:hypothetical protein P43SY_006775 [Pythium insidiosum]|uniref:Uncharacterized protein n=1 Tax=Pythium insidiosum TaxID=114742 RepID=A0AAD5MBK3_PYTIN|nr:hypothetical protein P43SY_006775 [Pythium insidiosum]
MEFTTYVDDGDGESAGNRPPTISEQEEGGSSDDEEDAWLSLEVARLVEEEKRLDAIGGGYKAQLMDEQELQSLHRAIRTRELQVERDGRMLEYLPRKPMTSPLAAMGRRRHGRTPRVMAPQVDATATEDAPDPFTLRQENLKSFRSLADEIKEMRELQVRYDEVKRMLLDHLDAIRSSKLTDRPNAQEAYEKLEELLAFAAKCTI